ncbi:DUF3572 domain-containing protein [Celeribacter indicus]|uniref:DUF3572 domain-containing protein n=1 Tax=Celeribacter indicus TaxID=1208324 RepID=A0A0B5DYH5_9RHOB|nr:DUF3572 domain-containing protein [Celeribacter indicus]AJE48059.1 hypothetical protein P73_3344 [Celeribacter indicus]SDW31477.1 Protein of unknown function [Celeribacter indicus]
MQQDSAELIALRTLAWLAAQDEIFPVFLGASGISAAELQQRARDGDVLLAVLDFVTQDDDWVTACAQDTRLDPRDLMRARHALPGGGEVHWT